MTDKQQTTSKQVPIKVLVFGEITASVFGSSRLRAIAFTTTNLPVPGRA